MARVHGKDCRVLLGERDASGDVSNISPEFTAATHDATTFGSGDWFDNDPGLLGWEASLEAFYDPAAAGIGRQLEGVGSSIAATTIVDGDADAIGDSAIVLGAAVLTKRSEPKSIADLMKLSATFKGSGKAGMYGKLLHVKGAETATLNGTALNNNASSANGGRGNLHVTAITGSWTIKVQHSANDVDWADLITFTQATQAGGATSQSVEVSGTVNQYIRAFWTEDVAGSCTFVAAFARY